MDGTGKESSFTQSDVHELNDVTLGDASETSGNEWDRRGMARIGKKQELRREFQFFSITGYAMILGCSWEFALINVVLTLPNGGQAGTIYMMLVAICGAFFICLSMAEMASMAPTAGGQYHWTSEFAPRKYQKILSFSVGFFCVLGWQTSLAATCFASAQQITALINLGKPSYAPSQWQIALFSWSILLVAIFANTVLFRKLPLMEGIVTFIHVLGFFAFVIVLWIMAPRSTASSVFTSFESNGWPTTGLACLIGVNGPLGYLLGADSSVHLAEELKNSAWRLPRSMLLTSFTNYITSFIIVVTLIFCLGDIDSVTESPTGQPYIAVVLNATQSVAATKVLAVVVLILVVSCSVNGVTTTSRQLWSFARDGGLPFSSWLSQIRPGLDVPVNAMAVSMVFTICLTSIAIGSEVAYGIFVSLNVSGLLTSYVICIACILQKRLRGEPLPASRFSLGKAGNAVNIIALCFLTVFWFFQFFPAAPSPAPSGMNWSCVIWISVLVFFMSYYVVWGRHNYVGPIALLLGTNGCRKVEPKPAPSWRQPAIVTINQTVMLIYNEDAAWMLLQVTGIAVLGFAVWKFMNQYRLSLSRLEGPSRKQTLSNPAEGLGINGNEESRGPSAWASMGKVTPLYDFEYRAVEPLRIYKFNPKYFLTMGLQKTDINGIIHIDSSYTERIKARQKIVRQYPGALDCLDSGVGMLNEFYEFLVQEYLPHRYPTIFRLDPSTGVVENLITNDRLPLTAPADRCETLAKINRNVDEDFLMLLPSSDGDGYSLQSFVWAYPVGFDPQTKLGIKLRDAHQPVPAYKEKLALSMDRYFSSLEPGNVKCRVNWALAFNDNLCERGEYHLYPGQEPTEMEFDFEKCRVRCELQTLFALPKSGGRILSVHLYLYPLQEIKDVGLGPAMAEAIDGLKLGNAPGVHRYKRAVVWGERVKEFLTN